MNFVSRKWWTMSPSMFILSLENGKAWYPCLLTQTVGSSATLESSLWEPELTAIMSTY